MLITESKITVRYAETDQMGVVHHAVYPIWYEVARTDFVEKALGIHYAEMEQMGVMTPLADLCCHYAGSARYGEEIIVQVRVSKLTPARIEFRYELYHQGENKPFNTGTTLHGWVDTKTFRPLNMKKKYPELYEKIRLLTESD